MLVARGETVEPVDQPALNRARRVPDYLAAAFGEGEDFFSPIVLGDFARHESGINQPSDDLGNAAVRRQRHLDEVLDGHPRGLRERLQNVKLRGAYAEAGFDSLGRAASGPDNPAKRVKGGGEIGSPAATA